MNQRKYRERRDFVFAGCLAMIIVSFVLGVTIMSLLGHILAGAFHRTGGLVGGISGNIFGAFNSLVAHGEQIVRFGIAAIAVAIGYNIIISREYKHPYINLLIVFVVAFSAVFYPGYPAIMWGFKLIVLTLTTIATIYLVITDFDNGKPLIFGLALMLALLISLPAIAILWLLIKIAAIVFLGAVIYDLIQSRGLVNIKYWIITIGVVILLIVLSIF